MLMRVPALCALSFALGAASLQAQDVFVLPGAGTGSGLVTALNASPFGPITTFESGNGSFLVLQTPDGTKFYVIGTQTVTSILSSFPAAVNVANLSATATGAVITPSGTLLAVAASKVYLFDTATDTLVVSGGITQGTGINTFALASSLDSSALFALGSAGNGTSQLASISTSSHAVSAAVSFSQVATAVAVGPNGLVYVSLPDEILELDPVTLQTTSSGTIAVNGTPGGLVFTADGKYAVAINQAPNASSTIFIVTLATHTVTAPNLGLPRLAGLQATGLASVSAFLDQNVYEIPIPSATTPAQVQLPANVLALTASNEVPTATSETVQSLYAVTSSHVYRINPVTYTATSLPISNAAGALSFTAAASKARPASLLAYGTNQSILPNATSEPLVVQVLDANYHPVSGVPVIFQSSSSTATLSSISAVTQANGYALIYLTAPATTGQITVTASVESLPQANFNINVSSNAGGANGPILSIVAGQGQLLPSETNTTLVGSPLEVLVTDSKGTPLPGVPVTFNVPTFGGSILSASNTVDTGANGTAQANFLTTSVPTNSNLDYVQTSVTATAEVNGQATNSVVFYITTTTNVPSPIVNFPTPNAGATLTGSAGGILPGGVTAAVYSGSGAPIPNVSLTLDVAGNPDPSVSPTVSCNAPKGEFILTNASGAATCDVLFGPRIGSGTFTATIGYTRPWYSNPFVVTAGAPAVVQITQGNNQVGTPGQTLPVDLTVLVTDAGGNPIPNTPVSWQVLTAGAVTLNNPSSVTNSSGNAYAQATLGAIGGVAQVQVTAGSASAVFNLTINIPSAGIQKISGDQQSTQIDAAFPLPLTVEVVNSGGAGLSGVQVNFQVTSGVATLGSSTATTGANGQASTTVTAGGTAGAITITATSASFSVTFTLTAQLPGPQNITIVNGASFAKGTGISPGAIATISGTGFLPGVQGLVTSNNIVGPLPTTLEGVTVTFGTAATPAPIYYVQSVNGVDEVTVQVPFEVETGSSVPLTISIASGSPTTVMIPVKPFAPGVFLTVYGGKTYPVAVRPDGSYVSPDNPAQLGEEISVYVTGLGQVTPATATGDAGVPGQSVVPNAKGALPLIIGLNNGGVPLISAEYAPGMVGVYVITFQVPPKTKTGPYQPLGVIMFDSSNKAYYANSTYLPIQ